MSGLGGKTSAHHNLVPLNLPTYIISHKFFLGVNHTLSNFLSNKTIFVFVVVGFFPTFASRFGGGVCVTESVLGILKEGI